METCTCCGFTEVKGEFFFHTIDDLLICDDCYDKDPPYKCTECKCESYDNSVYLERNDDCVCVDCLESGKYENLNNFYMCGR